MTSESGTNGGKRSAEAFTFASLESGEMGGAGVSRPAQKPRMEVSDKKQAKTGIAHSDAASSIGANVDVLIIMASFMPPDNELYNLCIAAGPNVASRIRHEYLLENDTYLSTCLRPLFAARNSMRDNYWWHGHAQHKAKFIKCGENIEAWMKVNKDWRLRCSGSNMEKYRKVTTAEGDLIFNNPVAAVELGLSEVVRFHMEKNGVLPCDRRWEGILFDVPVPLTFYALFCGNEQILYHMLSHDKFSVQALRIAGRFVSEGDLIKFLVIQPAIPLGAFELFISHPKVITSLNKVTLIPERISPLLVLMEQSPLFDQTSDEATRAIAKRKIDAMLQAGADPNLEVQTVPGVISSRGDRPRSAMEYARRQLDQHPDDPLRKTLVREMELWGFD